MRWLFLAIGACAATDPAPPCDASDPALVVATTDFTVGALAAVPAGGGCVADRLATVNGDPIVRYTGGALWEANRVAGDALRRYTPGDWDRPALEVALEPGANVHDLLAVDDALLVAAYDLPALEWRDPDDGAAFAALDLTAWADADGLAEPEAMVAVGDVVLVALQRFDRDAGWVAGEGTVLAVDPEVREVVGSWPTGPSPRLFAHPADPAVAVLITGVWGALDGEVALLDPAAGTIVSVVGEEALGRDLSAYAEVDGIGVIATASGEDAALHCVDWGTHEVAAGPVEVGWYVDASAGSDGVWVGVRSGWGVGATEPGLFLVNPRACAIAGERLSTSLEPYSLAAIR